MQATKPQDRREYHAARHAEDPRSATDRKQNERERMRIAVFYSKQYLIHGRKIPDFVAMDIRKDALKRARVQLDF